jgi:DNA-binding CsgD family transcriptional regulator
MGLKGGEREGGCIAELALASRDRHALREQLLDVLDRAVGFDKASLHCTGEAHGRDTCARGYDRIAAFEQLDHYMNEFEPQEIAAVSEGKPVVDIDVLSARRRDRRSIYQQFLRPENVTIFATVVWRDDHGVSGLNLARTGRGAGFAAGELRTLERLLPAIRLADAFVALRQHDAERPAFEVWADGVRLSRKERQVAALVVRGLANSEIAALLGGSPNTVRNQLASVFRKADVSTRAELVYVASTFVPSRCKVAGTRRWLDHLR